MSPYLLLWAALPAIAMSLWLLQLSGAQPSVQVAQFGVAAVAMAAYVAIVRLRRRVNVTGPQWAALPLALSLFIPLAIGASPEPARWLVLRGLRLYLAPLVLPALLVLLATYPRASAVGVVSVAAAASALVLQPDAPQLTALALALLVVLTAKTVTWPVRLVTLVVLLTGVLAAWRMPDPLAPVRYVEGVFAVAADESPWALVAAAASAALPVAALSWVAYRTRTRAPLAVAVYLAALFAFAPWQVTPVPLLGFGSGPVLGYFLVAGVVAGRDAASSSSS